MTKEEVRLKAIDIAISNYLYQWEGDVVDVYNRLQNEKAVNFSDISYAEVWQPFEYESIESVAYYISVLVDCIVEKFS